MCAGGRRDVRGKIVLLRVILSSAPSRLVCQVRVPILASRTLACRLTRSPTGHRQSCWSSQTVRLPEVGAKLLPARLTVQHHIATKNGCCDDVFSVLAVCEQSGAATFSVRGGSKILVVTLAGQGSRGCSDNVAAEEDSIVSSKDCSDDTRA
ncbi:hypothetical protein RRG08_025882 [Elysia crispata]|uniref:Uncharacterized protein n=1 Tax=Elysia crispata TaxID=231223 RepID=A0AAE0ZQN3_9GAST|nr:hypothetical protein RRG08_025882 [Elysia crispata]